MLAGDTLKVCNKLLSGMVCGNVACQQINASFVRQIAADRLPERLLFGIMQQCVLRCNIHAGQTNLCRVGVSVMGCKRDGIGFFAAQGVVNHFCQIVNAGMICIIANHQYIVFCRCRERIRVLDI